MVSFQPCNFGSLSNLRPLTIFKYLLYSRKKIVDKPLTPSKIYDIKPKAWAWTKTAEKPLTPRKWYSDSHREKKQFYGHTYPNLLNLCQTCGGLVWIDWLHGELTFALFLPEMWKWRAKYNKTVGFTSSIKCMHWLPDHR